MTHTTSDLVQSDHPLTGDLAMDHLLTDDSAMDHLLTDHHLGDVPAHTGDGRDTTVHLGRTSVTGGFDLPGEFDLPPEEPVQLVGEVPWELRED